MPMQRPVMMPNGRIRAAVVAALGLISAAPAIADDTAAASGGFGSLQEVIVTATKREQDLQSTPLAVTAISGDTLSAQGVTEFAEFASTIPGLGAVAGGLGQTVFSLRGMSTGGSNFQTQPPLGFYLDDTPITLPNVYYAGQWDPGFFDLARVEVLRGPQGTLYGAGALGGAVRMITNQPDASRFDARVRASAAAVDHGTPNASLDAMLNVPLVDGQLAWRTVASAQGLGGYVNQTTPSGQTFSDVNSQAMVGLRTALAWTPITAITLTPGLFFQHATSQGNPTINAVGGEPNSLNRFAWLKEPSSDELKLASLNLRADAGWFTVNSNNSWFYRLWNGRPDYSDADSRPWYTTLHPAWSTFAVRTESATSETRIQSAGSGPFQWFVGGYFQRQLNHQVQGVFVQGVTALTGGVYGGIPLLNDEPYLGYTGYGITQRAAFGELSYTLPFDLTLTVGGREFDINSAVERSASGYFAGGSSMTRRDAHSKGFIPKYELSYKFDETKMVYALADKGFRIGGPNNPIPANLCTNDLAQLGLTVAPDQFSPDTVWNYEVGSKTDWFDHRLRVDVAGYYMKWNNIQAFTNMKCGYGFTSNIASAKSQGVEVEMKSALGEHWAAGGTLSVNHAQYTSSLSGAGIVEGNRLESAPGTTGSAYVELTYPAPALPEWELGGHLEFSYTGNMQYAYASQNPTFQFVPPWWVLNGRVSLTRDKLSLSLYANNLLNRLNLNYLNSFPSNFYNLYGAGALPPRTIGIAVDKRF